MDFNTNSKFGNKNKTTKRTTYIYYDENGKKKVELVPGEKRRLYLYENPLSQG